jgi:hypothetical protein
MAVLTVVEQWLQVSSDSLRIARLQSNCPAVVSAVLLHDDSNIDPA